MDLQIRTLLSHLLGAIFLLLVGTTLSGQNKCQVRIEDINGMVKEWKDSTYQIEEEYFELTISATKSYFKFAKVEIREDRGDLTDESPILRTVNVKLMANRVVTTDLYVGDLAFDKLYELRVIYMKSNEPVITRRNKFIRRAVR
ncbi:hypothetical protein [Haliscomenobacter sp.]|uniref:hypothetical protein n=1 Tax=Haliscomenobacter sp. TaxID=2717303 RepID=UPI003364EFAC